MKSYSTLDVYRSSISFIFFLISEKVDSMDPMIKFKMTGGHQEGIELAYEANKTVAQYVEDLSELYDAPA